MGIKMAKIMAILYKISFVGVLFKRDFQDFSDEIEFEGQLEKDITREEW